MKNKTIVYLIFILMLVSNFIMFSSVNGADTGTYEIGFENSVDGDDDYYENGTRIYEYSGDGAEIDTGRKHTGSYSWMFHPPSAASFNITFDYEINKFKTWFNMQDNNAFEDMSLRAFNSDNEELVWIMFDNYIEYHDGSGWRDIDGIGHDTWGYLGFEMNDDHTVRYFMYDGNTYTNKTDTPYNPSANFDIAYIYVNESDGTGSFEIWFDDMSYNTSSDVTPSTYTTRFCEGYDHGGVAYTVPASQYLENKLGYSVYYPINIVDLYVDDFQYNSISSTVTDYHMEIDGKDYGNPAISSSTYGYRLRWSGLDHDTSGNIPVFEFKCDVYNDTWAGYPVYWYVGVEQGGESFRFHNTTSFYGNGLYDNGDNDYCDNTSIFDWTTNTVIWLISGLDVCADYPVFDTTNTLGGLGLSMCYELDYDNTTDTNGDFIPDDWTDETGEGTGTQPTYDFLPVIGQPLGSIIGFILVGFSILMPFIIAGSIGKSRGVTIQVPPLVYGFFGALGIAVSVILGMFPSWIVFFIVAIGVIIVALTYLLNLRQQGVV